MPTDIAWPAVTIEHDRNGRVVWSPDLWPGAPLLIDRHVVHEWSEVTP